MLVQTERLMEQVRCADPHAFRLLEDLLHCMPSWTGEADRIGDIPAGLWSRVPVKILNRMLVPPEYGGLELTATALRRVVVYEQLAKVCPALLIGMPGAGLSLPPVLSLGTEKQKREYCERFVNSDRPVWGAFAMTEPQGGSDATAIRTLAVAKSDGYQLSGQKCFITNGKRADVVVVFATISPDKGRFGIRAFLITNDCPGFSVDGCEDMMGLRASQLSSLSFSSCHIPKEGMLGHTGERGPTHDAFVGAQSAWDFMRPVLASMINGACTGLLEHLDAALRAGRFPMKRGAVAHALGRLAYLTARVHSARMLALRAAWKYDAGQRVSFDASMSKAYSSSVAMEVAMSVSRLLPLRSISSGDPVEKFYRDAKAFDILEGTGDMQRLMVARAFETAQGHGS